jgi:hypothetical protein
MTMLACIHHVTWLRRIEGGKHQCGYCGDIVTKKEIYPKFEDLGTDFQLNWDRHEKGEAAKPSAESPPK